MADTGQQTITIQQVLDLALEHHSAGRLNEAENVYRQILQSDPNQPDALHLLGVIAHQVGKNDIAVDLITKALAMILAWTTIRISCHLPGWRRCRRFPLGTRTPPEFPTSTISYRLT